MRRTDREQRGLRQRFGPWLPGATCLLLSTGLLAATVPPGPVHAHLDLEGNERWRNCGHEIDGAGCILAAGDAAVPGVLARTGD